MKTDSKGGNYEKKGIFYFISILYAVFYDYDDISRDPGR